MHKICLIDLVINLQHFTLVCVYREVYVSCKILLFLYYFLTQSLCMSAYTLQQICTYNKKQSENVLIALHFNKILCICVGDCNKNYMHLITYIVSIHTHTHTHTLQIS